MDPDLYNAATEGRVDVLKYLSQFETGLTPAGNTVLHVAVMFDQALCVKEILRNCNPSLLCQVNMDGETALHIAAREGYGDIVDSLIECARIQGEDAVKGMVRITNENGDTALHGAVQYCPRNSCIQNISTDVLVRWSVQRDRCHYVVKGLVKEDEEFSYTRNKAEETPLYLAAEKGLVGSLREILKTCGGSPSYGGPHGRTALHAAVIFDSEGCTMELLKWKQDLCEEVDQYGWTPVHYGARLGRAERINQILSVNKLVAYITEARGDKRSALHIAASFGHVDVMKVLLSHCPDCWEILNKSGQNILHAAVENSSVDALCYIEENRIYGSLRNHKDINGNTPLHLVASAGPMWEAYLLLLFDYRVDKMASNKENMTFLDMALSDKYKSNWEIRSKALEFHGATMGFQNEVGTPYHKKVTPKMQDGDTLDRDVRRISETQIIVATLVATVTFTAGFTLPGGYNGNDDHPKQLGMAILARRTAFQAFIIADTIALLLSTLAILIHFTASLYTIKERVLKLVLVNYLFIVLAIAAMMIAFVTGTYVVLPHSSALAIVACLIGSCYLLIYFGVLGKLILAFVRDIMDYRKWQFLNFLSRGSRF